MQFTTRFHSFFRWRILTVGSERRIIFIKIPLYQIPIYFPILFPNINYGLEYMFWGSDPFNNDTIRWFEPTLKNIFHLSVPLWPISVSNRGTIWNNSSWLHGLFFKYEIFRNLKSNHPVWDTVISNLKQPTIRPINDQLDHQLTISGEMMIHLFKIVILSFMIRLMALNDRSNVLRPKILTS